MHARFRLLIALVCLVVAAAFAEDLLICPACRREAPAGANFCPKCGANLGDAAAATGAAPSAQPTAPAPAPTEAAPLPSPATPAPSAPVSDTAMAEAATAGIRDCVVAGRKQFADGHPEVARLLFGNALALASLGSGLLTAEQGEALLKETQRCDTRLSSILAECTVCRGTGRMSMNVTSLGSSTTSATQTSVASGVRCRTCNGTGKALRRRTVAERKTAQGVAGKSSETVYRSMGFVQEGNALVPQAIAPLLDIAQRCRLRNAAATPCAQCGGFGQEDCRKCGATGYVPCKAKGCQNGWVVEDALNSLDSKSAAIKTRKACPECGGSAMIPCTACQGRGAQPCTRCNGSGQRGICTSCGGDGYAACRACNGTGHARGKAGRDAEADCPVCGGTGTSFCNSCHGDGHSSH